MKEKEIGLMKRKVFPTLEKSSHIFFAVLVLGVVLSTQGYCSTPGNEIQEIEAVTKNVMDTIFSSWVKRAALAFGAGAGLFQSYMGGSVKPLLLWGGLGLAVNYVPKIVEVIAKVGS